MTDFDLDTLMAPVDGETPAGPDLEYDPAFLDLERDAAPMAERVVGDSVKEARDPDWDKVAAEATRLLGRSKDIRVVVPLICAWTRTGGLSGWAAGLELLQRLLQDYWAEVHPRPDPEDDNDPTARANAIAAVCNPQAALGYFRHATVVSSPRVGRFSLRDLRVANGSMKIDATGGGSAPSLADIEACCLDCQEADLIAAANAADRAAVNAEAIAWAVGEQLGLAAPDLQPLLQDARELKSFLDQQVAQRCPQPAATSAGDALPGDTSDPAHAGRIESPQDVSRCIDRICDYYARHEPSSPVPILLRRAQRLIGRDFLALLQDIAPGGINELRVLAGDPDD
ncbi:MAG: hypothetical protein GAK28_00646 [Luteibacter sp.]|uniref:type VI secretion system protein TssA n=1 Tax=Luteibacter sp. TaxID=1886636 RepID=UPI001380EAEE|nr:type VI secretion system protein TssA [Luteibacter sp.]KAF1009013.1 MAG: hypothetical protein GAK28_00646 [Luteibacter sp.]